MCGSVNGIGADYIGDITSPFNETTGLSPVPPTGTTRMRLRIPVKQSETEKGDSQFILIAPILREQSTRPQYWQYVFAGRFTGTPGKQIQMQAPERIEMLPDTLLKRIKAPIRQR